MLAISPEGQEKIPSTHVDVQIADIEELPE
jgi:hypothetical protein